MNEQTTALSVVEQVQANPVTVLQDENQFKRFYEAIFEEVKNHVPDTTTEKGRKEIASLAYKVTRTKTTIDAAGKKLNEEARAHISAVDAQRRRIWDELEKLANEARKPLNEWEEKEKNRIATIKAQLAHIEGIGRGFIGPEMQPFGLLFRELEEKVKLDAETFAEFLPEAQRLFAIAKATLIEAKAKADKEAADKAELEKLRAEAAERAAKETAEREARAAEERRQAEEKAAAEAKATAEREAAEKAAAETARIQREAEERAQAEIKAAQEREQAAKREAERVKAEAEAKLKAAEEEARRKAAAEEAEKRRADEEQRAREADRAHRGKLMGEAKAAIIALGVDEETARKVVLAVVAAEVPHIAFKF